MVVHSDFFLALHYKNVIHSSLVVADSAVPHLALTAACYFDIFFSPCKL